MGNRSAKNKQNENERIRIYKMPSSGIETESSFSVYQKEEQILSDADIKKIADLELEIFNSVLIANKPRIMVRKKCSVTSKEDNKVVEESEISLYSKELSEGSSLISVDYTAIAEVPSENSIHSSIQLSLLKEKVSTDAYVCQSDLDVNAENIRTARWDYTKTDQWPKQCSGPCQSPIDINPDNVTPIEFPRFIFKNFITPEAAAISNNGHTVTVKFVRGEDILLAGGGLPCIYRLDNIHFHWEAEHTIKGKRFPLEIHSVFFDNTLPSLDVAARRQKIAILASFAEKGMNSVGSFEKVVEHIHHVIEPKRGHYVALKDHIIVNDFLPDDKSIYYRYYGSLTSPNCNEGVLWTIFPEPVEFGYNSINNLKKIKGMDGEFLLTTSRSVQPVNNRTVFVKNKL